VGPHFQELGPYDQRPARSWSKAKNWRIASKLTLQDLEQFDFCEFLQNV
jgi:hypothetical protein